jgi:hypothetical protein
MNIIIRTTICTTTGNLEEIYKYTVTKLNEYQGCYNASKRPLIGMLIGPGRNSERYTKVLDLLA